MEMICFGFLGGVIFSAVVLGAGVIIGDKRNNNEQLARIDIDDDNISSGDWCRSSDYRYYKSFKSEQKITVLTSLLHDYDTTLSPYEKDILKSLIIEFEE